MCGLYLGQKFPNVSKIKYSVASRRAKVGDLVDATGI